MTESNREEALHILALEAENVKRIRAVEIRPDPAGGLVIIGGANAAGKTSVLDCILYALGGERAIPSAPIREGESHAEISVDLGFPDGTVKFRVTRSITAKGSYLKLDVPADGGGLQVKAPQKFLEGRLGALTFDPLAFTRMKPAEQKASLLDAIGLTKELKPLEADRAEIFQERTTIGRQLTVAKGALASLPAVPSGTPDVPVDVMEITGRIEAANEARVAIESSAVEIKEARQAVADAEKHFEWTQAYLAAAEQNATALPVPEDTTELKDQLRSARAVNDALAIRHERERAQASVTELDATWAALSQQIAALDQAKTDLVADSRLPVQVMGFAEACVTFDGLPLDQAASSVRLRVSAAIGMALNPKLKIMRIEDGSLLDGENLNVLAEMAKANDFQIWIERVGVGDPGAVIIEDGTTATPGG